MSKTPIPCLVGFGGITPAGRASHDLGYTRMIYDLESEENKFNYLQSVLSLCDLFNESEDIPNFKKFVLDKENEVLENTLMRKFDYDFFRNNFWSYDYEMPANGCGQLPFQFNPAKHYSSRQHPKAIALTILAMADAFQDTGLDMKKIIDNYGRDKVGCFAGVAVGNLDNYSLDGLVSAYPLGQRASSKHLSFSLPEMSADFINAYVTGSLGVTGHYIGACATSLYNTSAALELIKSGKSELVIAGSAETIITPPAYNGFNSMGAMATDSRMRDLQKLLGEKEELDYTRFCRPFGDNMGMVCGESSGFAIFMSDRLALETGANIRGSFLNVNINADGNKKSISGPGAGNYFSMGKTFKDIEQVFGEDALRESTAVIAHGTGTPLNRITESHILSTFSKEFKVNNLPVTSVKSKLGHTMGAAGMDQLWSGMGAIKTQKFTGICTIPNLAEDVSKDGLDFYLENKEFDQRKDIIIINSKGFGGNNASAAFFSDDYTLKLIEKRYTKSELSSYKDKLSRTLTFRKENLDLAVKNHIDPIYNFDVDVLDIADLEISKDSIKTSTGFNYKLESDISSSDF